MQDRERVQIVIDEASCMISLAAAVRNNWPPRRDFEWYGLFFASFMDFREEVKSSSSGLLIAQEEILLLGVNELFGVQNIYNLVNHRNCLLVDGFI